MGNLSKKDLLTFAYIGACISIFFLFMGQVALAQRQIQIQNFTLPSQAEQQKLISPSQGTVAPTGETDDGLSVRISHDLSLLPKEVQKKRNALLTLARNGNLQAMRRLIAQNGSEPLVSYEQVEDPVDFLMEMSGDGEGQEILAILLEVLQAGYAHVDAGGSGEIFVWPYFVHARIDTLSPEQRVELFTLVTAGDYEDMKEFGAYNFYRIGISVDGTWQYFIAGD